MHIELQTLSFFFFYRKASMRKDSSQQHFRITVVLPNGKTKDINVKAATLETAERRALKRNPAAVGVLPERSRKVQN